MDIAIITQNLDAFGGAERIIGEIVRHLTKKRHDITVYCGRYDPIKVPLNCRVISHPFPNPRTGGGILNVLWANTWLRKIGKHDLYNFHVWPINTAIKSPSIWMCHNPPFYADRDTALRLKGFAPHLRFLIRMTLDQLMVIDKKHSQKINVILANSNHLRRILENYYGKGKVKVCYPGIDVTRYYYSEPKEKAILCVSRLFYPKRVQLLLHSMKHVVRKHPDAKLKIIGTGPQEDELKQEVIRLKLQKNIEFLQFISEERLIEEYSTCLFTTYPSKDEPFGLAPIESMASGKPCVVFSDGGGVCETITNGKTGFILDKFEELSAKIKFLLENPYVLKQMSIDCQREANRFSADGMLSRLESEFNMLI